MSSGKVVPCSSKEHNLYTFNVPILFGSQHKTPQSMQVTIVRNLNERWEKRKIKENTSNGENLPNSLDTTLKCLLTLFEIHNLYQ